MITNRTIYSNTNVEMENTNKQVMNKMKQSENIQNQWEDLIKRIHSLENQHQINFIFFYQNHNNFILFFKKTLPSKKIKDTSLNLSQQKNSRSYAAQNKQI